MEKRMVRCIATKNNNNEPKKRKTFEGGEERASERVERHSPQHVFQGTSKPPDIRLTVEQSTRDNLYLKLAQKPFKR
jgi:hypothetical protein